MEGKYEKTRLSLIFLSLPTFCNLFLSITIIVVEFTPSTFEVMSCTAFTIDVIADMPTGDGIRLAKACRPWGQEERLTISTVDYPNR